MPTKKLTAAVIPHLPPGEWWDILLPGLVIRVGKKRRAWSVRYHANGSYQRKALGHFPAMELGEARAAARAAIERADKGVAACAAAPHPRAPTVLTLGGLLDKYEDLRAREGRRTRKLPEAMRLLRRNLKPYLSLPADRFSKSDLRAARDVMVEAGTPFAANRLLGYLSPAMRWAAQEDIIPVNFVPAIRRSPEAKRERVLSRQEIKAIWLAASGRLGAREASESYGRMVRFLLLTAQRRGEVAALRHGHILDGIWRQTENKASRPHSITLPPLGLALVGQGEARGYVFAGRFGQLQGFAPMKAALDKASGVTAWRLHDLRRTAASNMQDLGISNHIVQAILNHAVPGVGAVYLRAELEKQKAEALAKWAAALTDIVGPVAELRA
jgi:integrase